MTDGSLAKASPASSVKRPRPQLPKTVSHSSSTGALLGAPRRERTVLELNKPEETMAACFLQYCAMCEKQITTPSNSILYCSEACYRKDSNKPLSAANLATSPSTPPMSPSSPLPILQPRTPTGSSGHNNPSSVRILADHHAFKSDLDPTEWKPKSTRSGRPVSSRYNSEAFRYLSSFHRSINKNDNNDHHDTLNEITIDVPNINAVAATAPTTPSLGNTPTTIASSWSISTSAGYAGHGGYDYTQRPLMPRHNRWYSTSIIGSAGTDLVTPHIPPRPEMAYAKKNVVKGVETPRGGLGSFFGDGPE